MPLIQAKQINKIQSSLVGFGGFTTTAALSDVVTPEITTALATAGNGGTSVPLQVSINVNNPGVITTGTINRVELWDTTLQTKIEDALGNEVYARLTEAAGVYTLSYYSLVAGAETPYTFLAPTNIDFYFSYRFTLEQYPADAGLSIPFVPPQNDPAGTFDSDETRYEAVTVTAQNTMNDLSAAPITATSVMLFVNGVVYNAFGGGSADFTMTGATITWNPGNAGFNIETTDRVIAQYEV